MRLHPYFDDHVQKFIALAVPFDGAGAISVQAPLVGYNLNLPFPRSTAKGVQCAGGCLHYLLPRPADPKGVEIKGK